MAKKITEESFADRLRSLISGRGSHNAQYYNMTPYLDSMGTTHVSVLAEDGTAVAATSSINLMFVTLSRLKHGQIEGLVSSRI